MTAKSFLSMEEMAQFPTLEELLDDSMGNDPEEWGLCQNGNQFYFGKAKRGWVLQVSLDKLLLKAEQELPRHGTDKIIFFYGYEIGTNNLEYNLCPFFTPNDVFQPGPVYRIGEEPC